MILKCSFRYILTVQFKVFINEWLELKRREFEAQRELYPEIYTLEEFLQKDDHLIMKKVSGQIESLDLDKII